MDAIIDAVAAKTGIDRGMVAKVAPAVIDFLAERLPGGVGDMLNGVAAGEDVDAGGLLGNLKGGLGGLLGG